MSDDLRQFLEIERKRKLDVKKNIQDIIERRKELNEKMQKELAEIVRNEHIAQELQSEYKTESSVTSELDSQRITNIPQGIEQEPIIQKEEIQKEEKKDEVQENELGFKTDFNIPISKYFIKKYVITENYIQTEKIVNEEKKAISKQSHFNLKVTINKRIGQITTDMEHVSLIIGTLKQYNDCVFYELVSIKILEQAKLQVASCFEFYKSYGMLLSNLYSPHLHSLFLVSLLYKKEKTTNLKGMYSIYFEFLRLKQMWAEAYDFLAGVLNEMPSFDVFYVVEAYLIVLGRDMVRLFGKRFKGILNYLREEFFIRGENDPCKVRIEGIIEHLR